MDSCAEIKSAPAFSDVTSSGRVSRKLMPAWSVEITIYPTNGDAAKLIIISPIPSLYRTARLFASVILSITVLISERGVKHRIFAVPSFPEESVSH